MTNGCLTAPSTTAATEAIARVITTISPTACKASSIPPNRLIIGKGDIVHQNFTPPDEQGTAQTATAATTTKTISASCNSIR
ncbi:MAG: hypothetical protein MUE44_26610 [Oscillatoriaceae cyanobacterium Prado104]|nr:hypothetical protein [Oscillatoriaceae cyanobacterium Prado104]